MSKITILVTNFQKSPFNLLYWWPEVPWFGQIVFFKLIITKSNFKNAVITSFRWCHHHYVTEKVTKITSQFFSICSLLPPP